jgi:regulator of replication initiation timing
MDNTEKQKRIEKLEEQIRDLKRELAVSDSLFEEMFDKNDSLSDKNTALREELQQLKAIIDTLL